jgi:glucose-1-phosphate adenylyltransferase
MYADENDRLIDLKELDPFDHTGKVDIYTNVAVINRVYLLSVVRDSIARGYSSFFRDIIARHLTECDYRIYRYTGFYDMIVSLRGYFACNMETLEADARHELFSNRELPVYTKVRNSTPTTYAEGAVVKNSLIAAGSSIEGNVENCIIFRSSHISADCRTVKKRYFKRKNETGRIFAVNSRPCQGTAHQCDYHNESV